MRVLHFALLAPGSPQWGLRSALRNLAGSDDAYREFDWYPHWARHGGQDLGDLRRMREEFLEAARAFSPEFVFLQIQTPNLLPGAALEELRAQGGFTLSWCGDLRDETPEWAWKVAPHVSLNCFSNGRDVAALRASGHAAEFLNIGFSPSVFCPAEAPEAQGASSLGCCEKQHIADVVFLGNNYGTRFPRSVQRQQMVAHLRARYGGRFAVFGNGWGAGDKWLDEPAEAAVYRGCKIAINQNHYDTVERFSSDRILRAMGSGAMVLSNEWPGMEQDFTPGKHLRVWHDFDELTNEIDRSMDADERSAVAAAGCRHVHEKHTWDARMAEISGFMETYRKAAA